MIAAPRTPFGSHDLEDIVSLIAARPTIISEIRQSPGELRSFLAEQSANLLAEDRVSDILAAHLNNAQDPRVVQQRVLARLRAMAESGF